MTDQPIEVTFYEAPDPDPAGVAPGYLVIWDGQPGPAKVAPAAMVSDGAGGGFLDVTGDFEDVTVTDC